MADSRRAGGHPPGPRGVRRRRPDGGARRHRAPAWEQLDPPAVLRRTGSPQLAQAAAAAVAGDAELLAADADPIHPARIYGELLPGLADDAVVIGDGGDFVSFAGQFVEPARPGGWLDPGPFGCLGTGLGYAIAARLARPSAQVVLLLGDGAAGFSLMDVDTLVRHRLPVVMVVATTACGAWRSTRCSSCTATTSRPTCGRRRAYDEVVRALGGAGETVSRPQDDRAGAGPGVRLRRALPRERPHRPEGRVPPHDHRRLAGIPRKGSTDRAQVGHVSLDLRTRA